MNKALLAKLIEQKELNIFRKQSEFFKRITETNCKKIPWTGVFFWNYRDVLMIISKYKFLVFIHLPAFLNEKCFYEREKEYLNFTFH